MSSFNLAGLTAYTEQNATALKLRAFFTSKSIRTFTVEQGYKGATTLNRAAVNLSLQAGGCGWTTTTANSVALTQRTLTPGSYKINMPFCIKDLEAYFTRAYLPVGQQANQSMPTELESVFMDGVVGRFGEIIERAIWQGDTGSGDANLNKFDGFNKILDVATSANSFNPATSAWSISTSFDIIDGVINAIPAEVIDKEDTQVYISMPRFREYLTRLRQLNLFHYNGNAAVEGGTPSFEIVHPGTNVKVVALNGLTNSNRIWAGQASNFVIGVDNPFESTLMDMWYSQDNREVRFALEGMMGVQVYYPEQIVRQVITVA
jgi:hypothetical protein